MRFSRLELQVYHGGKTARVSRAGRHTAHVERRAEGQMGRLEGEPSPDAVGAVTVVGLGRDPGQPNRGRTSAGCGRGTVFSHIQVD